VEAEVTEFLPARAEDPGRTAGPEAMAA
jgi:hypothetical protein